MDGEESRPLIQIGDRELGKRVTALEEEIAAQRAAFEAHEAMSHNRYQAVEQRVLGLEHRAFAVMDDRTFSDMLIRSFSDRKVKQAMADMVSTAISMSGLLTTTELRNWLLVFFGGLSALIIFLQYVHP